MKLYRLAKEHPGHYYADDLSGNGASIAGGRWNPAGMRMLYTCCHASTSVLEVLAHLAGILPVGDFFLVTLEVPDEVICAAYKPELPPDWADLTRDPRSTVELGRHWLEGGQQLAMQVPSVVCPTDANMLLNPLHADMSRIAVVAKEPFALDRRLFGVPLK